MKLLGVDVGTGGSRAVAVDEAGRVIDSATVEHEPFVNYRANRSSGTSRMTFFGAIERDGIAEPFAFLHRDLDEEEQV